MNRFCFARRPFWLGKKPFTSNTVFAVPHPYEIVLELNKVEFLYSFICTYEMIRDE